MVCHWCAGPPGVAQSSFSPFLTSSCPAASGVDVLARPHTGGGVTPPRPVAPAGAYGWPASVGDAVRLRTGLPGAAVWSASCVLPAPLPWQRPVASRLLVPAHGLASDRSAI